MAKMIVNCGIKYKGVRYYPNEIIEVDEKDIESFKSLGGWVVAEATKQPEGNKVDDGKVEDGKKPADDKADKVAEAEKKLEAAQNKVDKLVAKLQKAPKDAKLLKELEKAEKAVDAAATELEELKK